MSARLDAVTLSDACYRSKDLDTLHDWLVAELNAEAARPAPALADITASLEVRRAVTAWASVDARLAANQADYRQPGRLAHGAWHY